MEALSQTQDQGHSTCPQKSVLLLRQADASMLLASTHHLLKRAQCRPKLNPRLNPQTVKTSNPSEANSRTTMKPQQQWLTAPRCCFEQVLPAPLFNPPAHPRQRGCKRISTCSMRSIQLRVGPRAQQEDLNTQGSSYSGLVL